MRDADKEGPRGWSTRAPCGTRGSSVRARGPCRPRSVPVLVGTGAAAAYGHAIWWRAILAGVVAVSLQVGVNYANDYSDGVPGTDAVRGRPAQARRLGDGYRPGR